MNRYIQSLIYGPLVRAPFRAGGVGQIDRLVPIPTVLTSGSSTTDGTSVATASISPAASQPIIAVVCSQNAGSPPPEPTATGNGLTWVKVQTEPVGTTYRLHVFRAAGATPSAGAVMFDWGVATQTSFTWVVVQFTGANTTGTNGSGAVVQAPAATTAASTTSIAHPTLSAFEHIDNVNLSICAININGSITPDTNFTELADVAVGAANQTLEVQWARNTTGCTSTFASSSAITAMSLEIKAG